MEEQIAHSENLESSAVESDVPYCFCTLAFGEPYRLAAQQLARQLHTKGIELFVVTDKPREFDNFPGVTATQLHRTSILFPYNDKRFALESALQHYECAVLVDSDSEISGEIPSKLNVPPGMYAVTAHKSLEDDLTKHHPHNLHEFQRVAQKLGVNLQEAQWVCENLIILRKGENRERVFLDTWAFADRWLGIRRIFQGDHGYIGLSAAMAGYKVYTHPEFLQLREVIKHQGRKHIGITTKVWQHKSALARRIGFYRRLVKAYIRTLREPKTYWL